MKYDYHVNFLRDQFSSALVHKLQVKTSYMYEHEI